jgi:hypothetical protein
VAARHYDEVTCVPCWKDINPRFAAAYDLFGNGKTAVKFNVGRFVAADIYTMARANNPVVRAILTTTRPWTDTNGNFAPDCNLANPAAQDLSGSGGDVCGVIDNANFGKNNPRATIYDPSVLTGFGARSFNWQESVQIQHQLRPNVALSAGYFRTSWGAIQKTVNTALTAADFNSYCVNAPLDSRLPGGGGYPVCGLYDVVPSKFGQSQLLVTRDDNLVEVYNGLDFAVDVRLPHGLNLNGGVNTGRTETNNCSAVLGNPQVTFLNAATTNAGSGAATAPRTNAYCDIVPPWSADTQVKFSGTIPLPYQFNAALTYQNLPGIPYYGAVVYGNSAIAPSLGRNLAAGTAATVTVDVLTPQQQFEDRIQQLDFRFSRNFRVGNKRIEPEFDIYNALNESPLLSVNNSFGGAWRTPTQILSGRLLKFGAKVTF